MSSFFEKETISAPGTRRAPAASFGTWLGPEADESHTVQLPTSDLAEAREHSEDLQLKGRRHYRSLAIAQSIIQFRKLGAAISDTGIDTLAHVRQRPSGADIGAKMLISRRGLLGSAAASLAAARYFPADAFAPEMSFLAVGDWGHHNSAQLKVAAAMADAAQKISCRFVISLGDNFYDKGVISTSDPQWQETFERVYSAPSLQCPWYPVLGNHDHKGNAMAEVAYSVSSSRWAMAAPFYVHEERGANGLNANFFSRYGGDF